MTKKKIFPECYTALIMNPDGSSKVYTAIVSDPVMIEKSEKAITGMMKRYNIGRTEAITKYMLIGAKKVKFDLDDENDWNWMENL